MKLNRLIRRTAPFMVALITAFLIPTLASASDNTSPQPPPLAGTYTGTDFQGITGIWHAHFDPTGDFNIAKVKWYANDTLIGTVTTSPFALDWDTTQFADGRYRLRAEAFDIAGRAAGVETAYATIGYLTLFVRNFQVKNGSPATTVNQIDPTSLHCKRVAGGVKLSWANPQLSSGNVAALLVDMQYDGIYRLAIQDGFVVQKLGEMPYGAHHNGWMTVRDVVGNGTGSILQFQFDGFCQGFTAWVQVH